MRHKMMAGEFDLLTLHQHDPERFPFLLESVSRSTDNRYSILFAHPQQHLYVGYGSAENVQAHLNQLNQSSQPPHSAPDIPSEAAHLPFQGGWFVFLSYELANQFESRLALPVDSQSLPLSVITRIPAAVMVDHHLRQTHILVEAAYSDAFDAITALLAEKHTEAVRITEAPVTALQLSEDEPERFIQGVQRIRDYIRAGDVFQVNLSRGWQVNVAQELSAAQLYQRLRTKNPAPFACLAHYDDFAIISSSPERLVRVRGEVVETRPIAGTRPRSDNLAEDQRLLTELRAHPKEQAEHVMLLDLERNDLGRLCEYGSVQVDELMTMESYQHVHHIVSNIRGLLRKGIGAGDVLRAVFPGGTITGCPKIRCMEIIAELEQSGRGAYTGAVGYINHNGDMDFNILIRTMTQHVSNDPQYAQHLLFRTGAGIVIDSVPEHELQEARHKAEGLLRALGITSGISSEITP